MTGASKTHFQGARQGDDIAVSHHPLGKIGKIFSKLLPVSQCTLCAELTLSPKTGANVLSESFHVLLIYFCKFKKFDRLCMCTHIHLFVCLVS